MWMCKLFHPFMVQYAICIISNINYCSCDMQYYYTASKAKCTTADPMRKKTRYTATSFSSFVLLAIQTKHNSHSYKSISSCKMQRSQSGG